MPFRRSYERFLINDWATVILNETTQKRLLLRDLSVRGAGVVSNYPFQVNDKVKIVIKEPVFDAPVSREAKVIWSNKKEDNLWRSGLDFGLDNELDLGRFFLKANPAF